MKNQQPQHKQHEQQQQQPAPQTTTTSQHKQQTANKSVSPFLQSQGWGKRKLVRAHRNDDCDDYDGVSDDEDDYGVDVRICGPVEDGGDDNIDDDNNPKVEPTRTKSVHYGRYLVPQAIDDMTEPSNPQRLVSYFIKSRR